ncbi:hypothetical protein SUGI_1194250 [Cryptomeria japonica]|nr:hypothetical protein SUGI_1194250 [Cryptomeria japonica]
MPFRFLSLQLPFQALLRSPLAPPSVQKVAIELSATHRQGVGSSQSRQDLQGISPRSVEEALIKFGNGPKIIKSISSSSFRYVYVGSIEGRVAVRHIEDAKQSKNFSFKCHRDENNCYSVNSINFHPIHQTFATAGSDGAFIIWDKDNKIKLKAMARSNQPIPCSTFNNDGSLYAYAVATLTLDT